MKFKVKKIRQKRFKLAIKEKYIEAFKSKKIRIWAIILGLGFIFWFGPVIFQSFGQKNGHSGILPKFSLLPTDKYGHTNILFLGVAGKNEEGGFLSDSIMIASINAEKQTVSLLSFPRDLYIHSEVGNRKINEIYAVAHRNYDEKKALEVTKNAISGFSKIQIHYGAVINFEIFEEVIDTIGGIKLFVPEDIVDPFYPGPKYSYQTFILRKGIQNLEGATALKYARSRKTSSDYDRAHRQQELLFAIKQKITESGLLFDFRKLQQLYDTYQKNINTDVSFKSAMALAKILKDLDYKNLLNVVLNNDPSTQGGFLYAPDRALYGGQFVLSPINLKETQTFIQFVLTQPEILFENAQISILNGSKINGFANEIAAKFRRFGFHVIDVGNYKSETPISQSFYRVVSERDTEFTQKFIEDLFGFSPEIQYQTSEKKDTEVSTIPENMDSIESSMVDIEVVLGATGKKP